MDVNRLRLPLIICFLASVTLAGEKFHYLHATDSNWASLLPAPPREGSAQQKAEITMLLDWQAKRTPAQVARCKSEARTNAFYFSRVLGPSFNEHALPITAQLLRDAGTDAGSIIDRLKRRWNRPRPYVADARVNPCVQLEKASCYPSAHAIRGIVWATILCEIYPDKKDALMAIGRQLGNDRVIAGVHYPSDVAAGQKLGAAIAERLLSNHDFRATLYKAETECTAPAH